MRGPSFLITSNPAHTPPPLPLDPTLSRSTAQDDFVGYASLPVDSIRPGTRTLTVCGQDHRPLPDTTLLCSFEFDEP